MLGFRETPPDGPDGEEDRFWADWGKWDDVGDEKSMSSTIFSSSSMSSMSGNRSSVFQRCVTLATLELRARVKSLDSQLKLEDGVRANGVFDGAYPRRCTGCMLGERRAWASCAYMAIPVRNTTEDETPPQCLHGDPLCPWPPGRCGWS